MAVVEAQEPVVTAQVESGAVARPETVDAGTCISVADPTTHRSFVAAILELSKPRITRLVTMTAGVGFVLSLVERAAAARAVGSGRPWTVTELAIGAIGCIAGTAVSSGGANALNQWWERQRDARMRRTMNRPIPAGAVPASVGLWAGLAMSIVGVGTLLAACGPAAALVSLATILIYVLVYTPSKVLTPWNTLIGAIPGALPPLIGWCAAAAIGGGASTHPWWGSLTDLGGWSLFTLMAVWQIPHFLALAWMYRDDYAAGGYRMLPAVDPSGRLTVWITLLGSIVLVPATLAPVLGVSGALGVPYAAVAIVSGAAFVYTAIRMARRQGTNEAERRAAARTVFLASIAHLPLLLIAMTAEALVRAVL